MKLRSLFLILLLVGVVSSCFAANKAVLLSSATPAQYVSIGDNVYNQLFSGASGITFEGWIKPAALPTDVNGARIFHFGLSGIGTTALAMELFTDGHLNVYARSQVGDASNATSTAAGVITAGTWYHIAVVVDYASVSKSIRVYVNGIERATNTTPTFGSNTYVTASPGPTHADNFGIYLPVTDPVADIRPYEGIMEEFRVWKYARSLTEIEADMNKELLGNESNLIGYWKFNDGTGTTATDSSPSGKNGTLTNGASWTDGNPTVPIQLSSFTVTPTSEYFVQLHWVTQSETDVSGYYVFRNTINDIGTAIVVSPLVPATNTSSETEYSYIDEEVAINTTYYYWLQNVDLDGNFVFHGPVNVTVVHGGQTVDPPVIPTETLLKRIYPNPFNNTTDICFEMDKAGKVTMEIYNIKGAKVRTLLSETNGVGAWRTRWDGSNDIGRTCSNGIYYIKMTSGTVTDIRKIVLVK